MKLGTEEIKKLILSLMLFAGVIYCYRTFLLEPLNKSATAAETAIKTLEPQIANGKKQLQKTAQLELTAPDSVKTLDQIKSMIPEGAPVAWLPPRLADFFKRQGIDKSLTRISSEAAEKDMPGFRRLIWSVDLPRVEFAPLGIALAGLENEEPLLEINNVTVEAGKEEPQYQHAVLTVSTIVTQ